MTTENTAPAPGTTAPAAPGVTQEVITTPALPITEKQPDPIVTVPAAPAAVLYEPTGDPGLDLALEFVGKFGINPDDPAMTAAADGNFALLEAKMAAMGDKAKGFEKFLALGKASYASTTEKAKAAAEANAAGIHSVVGGEARWKEVQKWAGINAEPAEQELVNKTLQGGGIAAKAMAYYLDTLYQKAAGTVIKGKPAFDDNSGNGGPASNALSPRAYTKEVADLSRKLGGKLDGSPEYKQLQARRQAWQR